MTLSNSEPIDFDIDFQLEDTILQQVREVDGQILLVDEYYLYYRIRLDDTGLYRFARNGSSV
jgi:hypothetical protein